MSIKKEIFVTRKSFDTCIDITYGTDIFPIELRIADYVLPGSSIAVAYAIKQDKSGELKKSVCEISDNTIILNPKPGFFDLGKNMLQIRITASGKELYTYKGEVMCYGNIVSDDAKEVEDNPTLMEQILSTVGEIKEEVGTKQPLGSYVTTDDFDQEKSILNKSINDKVALEKEERIAANNAEEAERKREIAVERARIDAFAALPQGATSSDFALEDIKVKFNGETADTPGNAVREQTLYLDKKIDDETSRLSEEIDDLENTLITEAFTDIEPYEEVTGVYWYKYSDVKASYASASKYGHKKYDVSGLPKKVLITTYTFDTENCYFFVDDDNNIIKSGLFSEHRCGVLVDVPNGATKLYVNYYVNATTTEFNPYGVKGVTCIPNVDKETSPKTLMIADDSYKGYYQYNSINNVVFNDNVDFSSYMKKVKQGDVIRLVGEYFGGLAGYILTDDTMKPYFVKHTSSSGSASYDDTITIEKDGYVFYTEYGTSKSYQQGNVKNDILNGKKIGFTGDSITMASDINTIGYVEQIQRITGCVTQNLAVDGGTLASGTTIVATGANRFHVCEHLTDFDEDTDIYCLSGGYNDWGIGQVALGEYSDELNADYSIYDTTTLYGVLDYIFTWLMVNRSGKPIMYVITHNPLGYRTSGGSGETANITLKEWNEAIKKMLNKYSIPYVNLFDNAPLMTKFDTLKPFTVNNDGVHPNTEGYKRYYVPQILDGLRKICPIDFE